MKDRQTTTPLHRLLDDADSDYLDDRERRLNLLPGLIRSPKQIRQDRDAGYQRKRRAR